MSGVQELGENYIQDSILKIQNLKKYNNIIWHFIGKIQSNKTKIISENFHWCQTINNEKNAFLLNKHRPKNLSPMNVLIQINVSQELNKNGIHINECYNLARKISLMPRLKLRGVMAMPSKKNNIEYKKMKIIFDKLKEKYMSIDTLSLGTSMDIKKSLLVQSNMIRIGRSIFDG